MPPAPVLNSPLKPRPTLRTSFPRLGFVLFPVLPLLVYLIFPNLNFIHPVIIWFGCLNLFVLTFIAKGQINQNLSQTYRGLSVMTVWLILGIGAAFLLLLCVGALGLIQEYRTVSKAQSKV